MWTYTKKKKSSNIPTISKFTQFNSINLSSWDTKLYSSTTFKNSRKIYHFLPLKTVKRQEHEGFYCEKETDRLFRYIYSGTSETTISISEASQSMGSDKANRLKKFRKSINDIGGGFKYIVFEAHLSGNSSSTFPPMKRQNCLGLVWRLSWILFRCKLWST